MVQIKKVKPHMLIGLSGVGGVFTEEVDSKFLELMHLGLFMLCHRVCLPAIEM